jgi:hypothetical protein
MRITDTWYALLRADELLKIAKKEGREDVRPSQNYR